MITQERLQRQPKVLQQCNTHNRILRIPQLAFKVSLKRSYS
jgi:predicted DNA-binding transcriptional regulator AlpA